MAVLVSAGYRSAASILSVAKQRHVQAGRPWTDALSLAHREANRAATRGLGPPWRTAPFPLASADQLPADPAPWAGGGPLGPRNFLVVGCWWLLREIEAAHLTIGDITASGAQ
eukprot:6724512-Alexandrium_andersonii.AAC.1